MCKYADVQMCKNLELLGFEMGEGPLNMDTIYQQGLTHCLGLSTFNSPFSPFTSPLPPRPKQHTPNPHHITTLCNGQLVVGTHTHTQGIKPG
jgi:hypothetical protein